MTSVPIDALPTGRATAVGDGSIVVIRADDGTVCAFAARCPHAGESLDGALVAHGVIICPHHFWRFRSPSGANVAAGPGLEPVPATLDGAAVTVHAPPADAPRSFRQMMLDHARTWRRGD